MVNKYLSNDRKPKSALDKVNQPSSASIGDKKGLNHGDDSVNVSFWALPLCK